MPDWIETERTRLRFFEEADSEQAFTWFSDPAVMQFIPRGPDVTMEETRQRIASYRAHQARFGFSKRLIVHRETGDVMGDSGLFHMPDGERIELGYRLAKPYWGAGYALEVGRAWLTWFERHLAGQPLFADVHADNYPSQSVLAKLGFLHSHSEMIWDMPMLIYRHSGLRPRRANLEDIPAVASLHRLAFFHAMPHMPVLHTAQDDLAFYSGTVFREAKIWLCERGRTVVGFIAFRAGWVDHLYVHPEHQRQGIGSLLLSIAKGAEPELRLWTFQRNHRAHRFYERHGFEVERETGGSANDERQPDRLHRWVRHR